MSEFKKTTINSGNSHIYFNIINGGLIRLWKNSYSKYPKIIFEFLSDGKIIKRLINDLNGIEIDNSIIKKIDPLEKDNIYSFRIDIHNNKIIFFDDSLNEIFSMKNDNIGKIKQIDGTTLDKSNNIKGNVLYKSIYHYEIENPIKKLLNTNFFKNNEFLKKQMESEHQAVSWLSWFFVAIIFLILIILITVSSIALQKHNKQMI